MKTARLRYILGFFIALLSFVGIMVLGCFAISRSTSSTAAIGYIFLPFYGLVVAIPFFFFGYFTGRVAEWMRSETREHEKKPYFAVAAAGILFCWFFWWMGSGLLSWKVVGDIAGMNDVQAAAFLEKSPFRENKYALNALLERKDLTADQLLAIAQIQDPDLHRKMGSLFPVMGNNRKGLAVMRLVANHPNVDDRTLRLLALSPDEYVLGDVASNEKTPADIILRFSKARGYLMDSGLARNPKTPPEILHEFAQSDSQYTRASVAGNPNALPDDLMRLAEDPEKHVRESVFRNERCPLKIRKSIWDRLDDKGKRLWSEPMPSQAEERVGQLQLPGELKLKVDLEGGEDVGLRFKIESRALPAVKKEWVGRAGEVGIPLALLPDGDFCVSVAADGYAGQWHTFEVKNGKLAPGHYSMTLFKKRYAVMRYCLNLQGSPILEGENLDQGKGAFSHGSYGNRGHYLGWTISQGNVPDPESGKCVMFIRVVHHASNRGVSLRREPFDGIADCKSDQFSDMKFELKPGRVFTVRSSYREEIYGKFEVLDVVDAPLGDCSVY